MAVDFHFDAARPANREQMRWLLVQSMLAVMRGDKETAERLLDEALFIRDLVLIGDQQKAEA